MSFEIYHGDSLDIMGLFLPDSSVDAIVCDPPYGLSDHNPEDTAACLAAWVAGLPYVSNKKGFMGKTWDSWVPGPEIWRECFRVLKPGGHIVAFAGSRTHDLMSIALRLAGFECRDTVMWLYGTGFPKSRDISKDMDRIEGVEREVVGVRNAPGMAKQNVMQGSQSRTTTQFAEYSKVAVSDLAKQWEGWGTALKPAFEPVLMFRKPLIGTVAENVLTHGVGGLNIDGCRIGFESDADKASAKPGGKTTAKSGNLAGKAQDGFVVAGPIVDDERLYWSNETGWGSRDVATIFHDENVPDPIEATGREPATQRTEFVAVQGSGRWPANLILSYNEDEFELRAGVTAEQKKELLKFLYENT